MQCNLHVTDQEKGGKKEDDPLSAKKGGRYFWWATALGGRQPNLSRWATGFR